MNNWVVSGWISHVPIDRKKRKDGTLNHVESYRLNMPGFTDADVYCRYPKLDEWRYAIAHVEVGDECFDTAEDAMARCEEVLMEISTNSFLRLRSARSGFVPPLPKDRLRG